MSSLNKLMKDLQNLSGISTKEDYTPPPLSIRRLFEGGGRMASREGIRERVEGISERLDGVVEFLDGDNVRAATVAFKKILEDADGLLKEMISVVRKDLADKKKDKQDQQDEEPPEQDIAQQRGRNKGQDQQDQQDQGQQPRGSQRESRDTVFSEGILIENISDPFGCGPDFKQLIARAAGIRDKK